MRIESANQLKDRKESAFDWTIEMQLDCKRNIGEENDSKS